MTEMMRSSATRKSMVEALRFRFRGPIDKKQQNIPVTSPYPRVPKFAPTPPLPVSKRKFPDINAEFSEHFSLLLEYDLPFLNHKMADIYTRVGLHLEAIRSLDIIPFARYRDSHTWIRYANSYLKLGEFEKAADALKHINVSGLSAGQLTRYHILTCQIMHEVGDVHGSLDYIDRLEDQGELPIDLEALRLHTLASLREDELAAEGYLDGMRRPDVNVAFANAAANYFHLRNNQVRALAVAAAGRRRWQYDIRMRAALCRSHWSVGNMPAFLGEVKAALSLGIGLSASFAGHAAKAAKLDAAVSSVLEKVVAQEHKFTQQKMGYWALDFAHAASILGRDDIALDVCERFQKRSVIPNVPMARLIMANCMIADGRRTQAFTEIKEVLKEAPQMNYAYQLLFMAAATGESLIHEVTEILDGRRARVARYRQVDTFGRRLSQDTELIWLHYLKSEYEKGLLEKVNRRALLSLTYLAPDARPAINDFRLDGGKSLFLIADDGVSDEVRWTQYYPEISRRYKRVEATCDPRLLGIMSRSFPNIKFHPLPRIWTNMPKRFTDLREDIPDWEVAHYLDRPTLERLKTFERAAFTNEIILATVKEKGSLIPSETAGGYLKPDRWLKWSWGRTINKIAGRKKKVGILWRSGLVNRKRTRFYFELEALQPILDMKDCEVFSLQHAANPEELAWCREHGINVLDVDLFDDLEGVAAIASQMDVVIGPSTLPLELAAAVGTPAIIPGLNLETVGVRLDKGGSARCRHSKNTFVACDPEGYEDPDADVIGRFGRVMDLINAEIRAGTFGAGLRGY